MRIQDFAKVGNDGMLLISNTGDSRSQPVVQEYNICRRLVNKLNKSGRSPVTYSEKYLLCCK